MIVVSVLYPNTPGTHFDEAYYTARHIPLVKERWTSLGLQEVRLMRGLGTPDGGAAPYRMTALLSFDSTEALQRCAEAHGAEVFGDIPNFTDVQPALQVNEPV